MKRRKHPYEGTEIAPERTQVEITRLLKDFGCEGIRWTDMVGETPLLEFIYEIEIEGVRKKVGVRTQAPRIERKDKQRRIRARPAESMRLLYWWIKSELEAVTYGLKTFEEVFLSEIIVSLPDGTSTTFGETVKDIITKGEAPAFEKLGEKKVMMLPEQKEEGEIIDV